MSMFLIYDTVSAYSSHILLVNPLYCPSRPKPSGNHNSGRYAGLVSRKRQFIRRLQTPKSRLWNETRTVAFGI